MADDVHFLSLSEVCRRLKSGALRSAEVTQHMIERCDRLQPQLHAYALQLSDRALARAEQLDEMHRSGGNIGPLHGVPIAVKDLLYLQGFPTASGTLVMEGYDPGYSATVVERLETAGAVILGKTQLTEGAFGNHHPEITAPVNPWNSDCWPGVSSSGSGVAVSAGMAFGALGSDTGGSIRFPSACCGVVGIKPTYGRVSRYGAFPLAESLDHIGPMARSVEDAARLLGVIAGEDSNDPSSSPEPVPNYLASMAEGVRGLRIGVDWRYVEEGVAAPVSRIVREAVDVFSELGASIHELRMPPSYELLAERWAVTTGKECARAHADFYPSQSELYGPSLASLIELGRGVGDDVYRSLEDVRALFTMELNQMFEQVDLMIAPAMVDLPLPIGEMDGTAEDPKERSSFLTFTAPYDYSGHPTLNLPSGLVSGLPGSIQLIGRHFDEACIVRAAHAYEQAVAFNQHPSVD